MASSIDVHISELIIDLEERLDRRALEQALAFTIAERLGTADLAGARDIEVSRAAIPLVLGDVVAGRTASERLGRDLGRSIGDLLSGALKGGALR